MRSLPPASRGHSTSTRRSEGTTLGGRPQHCPGLLRQKHPYYTYRERNMNIQKYVQQDKTKEFQLWRQYWKNAYLTVIINSLCWRAGCPHATILLQIGIQSGFHLYMSAQADLVFLVMFKDAWTQLCLILMYWSIIYKRPSAKLYYSHEGPGGKFIRMMGKYSDFSFLQQYNLRI